MNPRDRQTELSAIEDRAADWLTRRDAGMTEIERSELAAWLAADARHRDAFEGLEAVWRIVTLPSRRGRGGEVLEAIALLAVRRRRRRGAWSVALGAAAAAVIALVWLRKPEASPSLRSPATEVAGPGITLRPERHVLADGSAIELDAGAEFEAAFTPQERRLRLVRGTAHFEVASDPARPFVVVAGPAAVRAIGTEFVVRRGIEQVDVLVTEGLVQLAPATEAVPAAPVLVSAGRRALVAGTDAAYATPRVEEVSPAVLATALAWRTRRVEFSGLPLAEVMAVFNASNALQLELATAELGTLRVSGIFWTNNPAGFAELIAASFDLAVEHPRDGVVRLRR